MNHKTYKIRLALILPLAIIVLCLLALSFIALLSPSSAVERMLLPSLFFVTLIYLLENLTRRVSIGEKGLRFIKFFRARDLSWNDIHHVAGLNLKSKLYLLLTTNKGFFFLSNRMARFAELSADIISGVERDRVEPEALDQLCRPRLFIWPMLYFWGASLLIILLTFFKITHL